MDQNSLGLIEVRGVVAALEVADACLKAANVAFVGHRTMGGVVTLLFKGDVEAIKASVEAGTNVVNNLGAEVGLVRVIARPSEEMEKIISEIAPSKKLGSK